MLIYIRSLIELNFKKLKNGGKTFITDTIAEWSVFSRLLFFRENHSFGLIFFFFSSESFFSASLISDALMGLVPRFSIISDIRVTSS